MQFRSVRRKTASPRGITLGGDLGHPGAELGGRRWLDVGRDSGGASEGLDQGRIGQADGINGTEGQLGGVRGDLVPFDCGGKDRAGPLFIEEGRDEGLEINAIASRFRDQLGGTGRGRVHIQSRERGDGQHADDRGRAFAREIFDPRSSLPTAYLREGLHRRSPQLRLRCGRSGHVTEPVHRSLELPETGEPDRGFLQRGIVSLPSSLEEFDQSVKIRTRLHISGECRFGERIEGLDPDRRGKSAGDRLLVDVVQIADGPPPSDHLDDRTLPGLGDATALE